MNTYTLGVAVAIEDGLLVPVIKFSDKLNIQQIGAELKIWLAEPEIKS